jgi:hypothetical protein
MSRKADRFPYNFERKKRIDGAIERSSGASRRCSHIRQAGELFAFHPKIMAFSWFAGETTGYSKNCLDIFEWRPIMQAPASQMCEEKVLRDSRGVAEM